MGSTLARDVSWKVCELGRDGALRTITPVELFALAERHHLDLGFAARMSYPILKRWLWSRIEPLWKLGATSEMPDQLRECIEGKRAIVINTKKTHEGTLKIIWGKELFSLELNPPEASGALWPSCNTTF